MKRRITFIYEPDHQFDPDQLDFQKNSLRIKSLKAAREERWTTSLSELPQEARLALKQLHELRIRWASTKPYASTPPFASSIPAGLHLFLTPQKERSATLICPLLNKIFGGSLNCTVPEDVFTRIPIAAQRFAFSASLQYHDTPAAGELPNLVIHSFLDYFGEKICPKDNLAVCEDHAATLKDAKYVDVDYDAISQAISLSVLFDIRREWNEQIENPKPHTKVEIGILANQDSSTLQELSLGGYLATLGEDTKAKPTLFSFPSRHHLSESNYTTSFTTPTGLHPTLRLTFPTTIQPPTPSCALHTYLTLPSSLFPDKYQLSQPNLLKSNNLASLRFLSPRSPDLEAPAWAVKEWGSALLLELSPPPPPTEKLTTTQNNDQWHASLPLHLRYLPPSPHHSHHPIKIPNPIVFWACPSSHTDGPELDTNPFDRTNLGYDGLFGSRTLFFHLKDVSASTPEMDVHDGLVGGGHEPLVGNLQVIQVPVLDVREAWWVEAGTGAVVLAGCGWVVWCLLAVVIGLGRKSSGGRKKVD